MKKKFEDKLYYSNVKYSKDNSTGIIFRGGSINKKKVKCISVDIFLAYIKNFCLVHRY